MADKDSRPGGMLEISPALERDMEKAAAGKIEAPPIEAFMSDSALQAAEAATSRAAEPVHAEDLRPISHAEAARRTTFGGETLPSLPAPRRVIPAPFRRPSVRGGTHGKTWKHVRGDQVREGDIITDIGLVTSAHGRVLRDTVAGIGDVAVGVEVVVTGAGGVTRVFRPEQQVRVFRS